MTTPVRTRRPTVLVVDDEPGIGELLRAALRPDGLRVLYAAGGPRALALIARRSVDLALLDLRMPGMDGLETLRRIQKLPRAPRVVVLTAHGHPDSARQAMRLGASDYLTKPFQLDFLRKVILETLRRPSPKA